ncbi:E3 ubiquitin-protein ligase UHRF1 [Psilocybe cubensis]|uniref:E3 ubiquitin-protein ligase UHRF1 n=1 Tax=Psilocybe cubensis TaxID=181762 RepID=A0ACB8GIE0_PSICU|nr:E3 ubiquitin-protein ligase UHRF1 [Psilocybe cubensis]KAH9475259.1 E3 ubiquitin-protein ligase UHRF1 [Psilocybe cubensis]
MAERLRRQFMESQPDWFPTQQDPRFGPPAKYPIFHTFRNRIECSKAGIHAPTVAGIAGTVKDGAFSICVSGGYRDDKDEGDFMYVSHFASLVGTGNGKQVEDQSFTHPDNAALLRSFETKRPVRVVRGFKPNSVYAPAQGYRYDGMYVVENAYMSKSKETGYMICTYELRRVPGQPPIPKREL